MKKSFILPLALVLVLGTAAAQADTKIEGTVEAVRTHSILAPYTGVVEDYSVAVGDELAAGEALFELRAEPVYAEFDGVITGVFAQPGDSAASVQSRYDGLCWMERTELYEGKCSTSGGDSENENKLLHAGEKVFIRSKSNESRKGVARVISVSGNSYRIEVLDAGKMRYNEEFKVYRQESYDNKSCVGSGVLSRIDPIAVTAEGWVRSVYVQQGQRVSRGDVLFEIVPDALADLKGSDGMAVMPQDGMVMRIDAQSGVQAAKDEVLATYCTQDDVRVVCPTDEDDLVGLKVGTEVMVTLDGCPGESFKGVVEKIASVAKEGSFDVTVQLQTMEGVRVGMSATVEF